MDMIPQTVASNNCLTSFQSVSQRLGVFKHLKSCGFKKRNGASVDDIISTVLYSKLKGHENLYRYYDDDSMLERPKIYKTELAGRLFDHVFARQVIGYADLQKGWTDDNSFIHVRFKSC